MNPACTPRRLRQILGGGFSLAMLLTLFIDIAVLVVPIYDMQLYDRVLQSQNMNTLTVLSFACVVGLLIYAVLDYLRGACLIAISEQVGRHLDGAVLSGTIRLAAGGDRKAGPELMRDLNELQSFLASGAVAAPLDALCAPLFLAVMFMLHPAFGCVGIAGISLLVLAGLLAEWLVRAPLLAAQAGRTEAGTALARSLADPELADGLGMLPTIARRWVSRHGAALARLDRASGQALGLAGLSRCLRFAVQVANMTVGAILVLAGVTTPGSLMGSNLLVGKALGPFDHLVSTWRHWVAAHASWRRIEALLRSAPGAPADIVVVRADAPPGLLVEGLDLLAADGRALLLGIDLHIAPGTLVVLAGPNGAGKTTLLRLLAGLVSPTRGTVLLDGAPIAGGTGFLPQTVSLLEGTLAENIARFDGDALEDAVAAAQRAEVHAPIGRLQHGYATKVAGNGAALSGGMRQRVGLARALCGSPRLLLLDEPDASLDAEGSAALVRALRESCTAGAIAIVTSHRPSLRDAADLVLTLRQGTLEHREPLARPIAAQLATA